VPVTNSKEVEAKSLDSFGAIHAEHRMHSEETVASDGHGSNGSFRHDCHRVAYGARFAFYIRTRVPVVATTTFLVAKTRAVGRRGVSGQGHWEQGVRGGVTRSEVSAERGEEAMNETR
jgi:hypothetical protein